MNGRAARGVRLWDWRPQERTGEGSEMGTIREIRFALRSLRKSPAMTATAIGVAALRAE